MLKFDLVTHYIRQSVYIVMPAIFDWCSIFSCKNNPYNVIEKTNKKDGLVAFGL